MKVQGIGGKISGDAMRCRGADGARGVKVSGEMGGEDQPIKGMYVRELMIKARRGDRNEGGG